MGFANSLLPVARRRWVRGRVDLNRRTEEGEVTDGDLGDVQHDAVEIEENALAEDDVGSVVAIERRLHPGCLAACPEQGAENMTACRLLALARYIELLAEIPCTGPRATNSGSNGWSISPASIFSRSVDMTENLSPRAQGRARDLNLGCSLKDKTVGSPDQLGCSRSVTNAGASSSCY